VDDSIRELYNHLERNFSDLDIPVVCSKKDLEDLRDGFAWRDIKNHLVELLVGLRDRLESAGESVDRNMITHIQAEIYSIRLFLDLPDILISSLEAEEEKEKEE